MTASSFTKTKTRRQADKVLDEWRKASRRVHEIVRFDDTSLHTGGLYCSHSMDALEDATGRCGYTSPKWSAAKVRRLAKSTNWTDVKGPLWAVLSAREFLLTAAKLGASISFD